MSDDHVSDPLLPKPGHSFSAEQMAVLKALAAWGHAEAGYDAEGMRAVMHEKFLVTGIANGSIRILDRAGFIQTALAEYPRDSTHEHVDQRVILDGDTAGVMFTENIYFKKDGADVKLSVRITATFVRRDDAWVCLFEEVVQL